MKKQVLILILISTFFYSQGQNYEQIDKLIASDFAQSAEFGNAVTIDGDYAIVGAAQDNTDVNGNNPISQTGAVYVYKRNTITDAWEETQKIVASSRELNDLFGKSIALDKNTFVVGASSKVYVFDLNTSTGLWEESEILTQNGGMTTGFSFGKSVDIYDNEIIVGSPNESGIAGVFIFEKQLTGNWLRSEITSVGSFGSEVAIYGDYALVGNPTASVTRPNNTTAQQAGQAYIYKKSSTTGDWEFQQTLARNLAIPFAFYGSALDLTDQYAVIGAPKSAVGTNNGVGRVWFFELDNQGDWIEEQSVTPSDWNTTPGTNFGGAISIEGDIVVIGYDGDDPSSNTGSILFYKRGISSWTLKGLRTANDIANGDRFGISVDITEEYVIAGSFWHNTNSQSDAGAAYIYFTEEAPCTSADVPTISATKTEICSQDEITLSINSGELNDATEWKWYLSGCGISEIGTGTSITQSPSGQAEYFVRGETGCDPGDCESIIIKVNQNPTPTIIQQEDRLYVTEEFGTYQWVTCEKGELKPIDEAVERAYIPTTDKLEYNVIVTNKENCAGSAKDCFPFVITGIENQWNSQFFIYPNPSEGQITLENPLQENISISVFDVTGKLINTLQTESTVYNLELPTESGLYLLQVQSTDGKTAQYKIIKE